MLAPIAGLVRRPIGLALVVSVLAVGCAAGARHTSSHSVSAVATGSPGSPAPRTILRATGTVSPHPRSSAGSPSTPASTSLPPAPRDAGPVGADAFFFLNARVPALTVEIDAVAGRAPRPATVDLLLERLRSVVSKPGGIDVPPVGQIPGSGAAVWTPQALADLEARSRDWHNSAGRAAIHLLFLDGRASDESVIGEALSASAAVIFVDQIRAAATPLVTASEIERSATVHEVGHLLSLVGLTYRSPRPHEDPDHPGHSSDPNSVMYWAVDNVGVANLLGGRTAPPTDFDADDRADLADVKAGRLG